MASEHRFLRFILPKKWFEAVKAGARQWLIECPCGFKRDLWDVGGVRTKAAGEPRSYSGSSECGKGTWHKIRRKSDEEKKTLG